MFIPYRKRIISIIRSPTKISLSEQALCPEHVCLKRLTNEIFRAIGIRNKSKRGLIPPMRHLPNSMVCPNDNENDDIQLCQNIPWMKGSNRKVYGIRFIAKYQTGLNVKARGRL